VKARGTAGYQAGRARQGRSTSRRTTANPEFPHSMHPDLRHALDTAYERLKHLEPTPADFASSYGLCLGMIMGARTCGGISKEEAAIERAHLSMLAALYEIRLGVRSDSGSDSGR
jgi:hypothetical protein